MLMNYNIRNFRILKNDISHDDTKTQTICHRGALVVRVNNILKRKTISRSGKW